MLGPWALGLESNGPHNAIVRLFWLRRACGIFRSPSKSCVFLLHLYLLCARGVFDDSHFSVKGGGPTLATPQTSTPFTMEGSLCLNQHDVSAAMMKNETTTKKKKTTMVGKQKDGGGIRELVQTAFAKFPFRKVHQGDPVVEKKEQSNNNNSTVVHLLTTRELFDDGLLMMTLEDRMLLEQQSITQET